MVVPLSLSFCVCVFIFYFHLFILKYIIVIIIIISVHSLVFEVRAYQIPFKHAWWVATLNKINGNLMQLQPLKFASLLRQTVYHRLLQINPFIILLTMIFGLMTESVNGTAGACARVQ